MKKRMIPIVLAALILSLSTGDAGANWTASDSLAADATAP